jgi:hypothetical protein
MKQTNTRAKAVAIEGSIVAAFGILGGILAEVGERPIGLAFLLAAAAWMGILAIIEARHFLQVRRRLQAMRRSAPCSGRDLQPLLSRQRQRLEKAIEEVFASYDAEGATRAEATSQIEHLQRLTLQEIEKRDGQPWEIRWLAGYRDLSAAERRMVIELYGLAVIERSIYAGRMGSNHGRAAA